MMKGVGWRAPQINAPVCGASARNQNMPAAPANDDHLPATRGDLRALGDELRGEMSSLREELRSEMNSLREEFRSDMNSLREELRGEMNSLRDELRGEMNSLRDELRGEMNSLREELRGEMNSLRDELRGEMNSLRGEMSSLREDMIEAIRDAQTELLRAFHGYATSVGARISVGEAHDAAFAARLSALEDRVLALETRPPRP
jgi:DNA repair exonuclease SbcCD ATPase subunit